MTERVRVQCWLDGKWFTIAKTGFPAAARFMFRCRDKSVWRLRTKDGFVWKFDAEGAFRCERLTEQAGSSRV